MIQAKEAVLTWDWGNFVADCGREMARVFAVSQELKSIRIVAAKGDQMRSWLYLAWRNQFEGTWNKTALTIKWPAGTQEVLKRGRSYWQ
jgi:hypothetical protein